jgi:hypothetical protein
MATYYVYSAAAGSGTGADWANAFTTLAGAFSGKAAGDIFYVADDHAETQASAMTLTSPGTIASPCKVICVRRSGGSVPPVSADLTTTATITTTGANAITVNTGYTHWYGITLSAGSGSTTVGTVFSQAGYNLLENCTLSAPGTSNGTNKLHVNNAGQCVELKNSNVNFGAVGDAINVAIGEFSWRGGTLTGAVLTTGLIVSSPENCYIEGVDLSLLASGSTIFRATTGIGRAIAMIKDCKLGSSVTVSATPTVVARLGGAVQMVRCDSGATNYRTEKYAYTGTMTTETTIVRTGGATDGTTAIARKVVTTANAERMYPFELLPISIWNETTGSSVTVTVECRGAAVPNTDEMWMDVEFLGTSGNPQGSITSTQADILTTGTACTSSSASWGGGTSSFKLTATVTPQHKGPITAYVKIAKVSSTFYVDPMITLT